MLGGHWAQVVALCNSITAVGSKEHQLLDQLACQAMLNAQAVRALSAAGRSSPGQQSQFVDAADAGCHLVRAVRRNLAAVDGDRVENVGCTYLLPPLSIGGALVVQPWLRFHIPLIEPDKQISRIRLSDKTSRFAFACDAICSF